MELLTRLAIRLNRVTFSLVAIIVITGISTYYSLPSQEDPEITIRNAKVITQFPGMSAERVEQYITKPLEEAIKQLAEVKNITSISSTGSSDITVEVGPEFNDLLPIWTKLRNKVNDSQNQLPEGTYPSVVNDDFGRVSVATYALVGDEFTYFELGKVVEQLRDKLAALSTVSTVNLYGLQQERVWLEIDPIMSTQLGTSVAKIAQAIRTQNIILPGGRLNVHGNEYFIEPTGDFTSLEDLRKVPINIADYDSPIYLRDVVNIRRDYQDPMNKPVYLNGTPAIVLAVSMVKGINISDFGSEISTRISRLKKDLPLGMQLVRTTYQPLLVADAIDDATVNLFQTIATVLTVVILFLGIRTGAIVGAIVPLTILAALIGMSLWGVPLHRISIAAIIIALGLLVDNGIVIAEDITRRLQEGEDRLKACLASGKTLSIPLLTSSLTTILAFMPLLLAEDASGEFVRALSQVMIVALLSSWFLAITIIPSLCYLFLKPGNNVMVKDNGYEQAYKSILNNILLRPGAFILIMVMLLVVAVIAMKFVTPRLMPPSDRAQYVIHLELPAGSTTQSAVNAYHKLAQWLTNKDVNPEIVNHVAYISHGGPRFFLALSPVDPVPHTAFIVVNTTTGEGVTELLHRSESYILKNIPEARGRAEKLFIGATKPGTVELRVVGEEISELNSIASKLERYFAKYQV